MKRNWQMKSRKLKRLISIRVSFLILMVLFLAPLKAQESFLLEWKNYVSNSRELPFWFHQQQYGLVDQHSANSLLTAEYQSIAFKKGSTSITPTIQLMGRLSKHSTIYFNQFAVKTQVNGFIINAGRFRDPLAESLSPLSTGSFIISRNTTPIPKIAFYTDDYIVFPGTNGIIAFDALFAHGWLENTRYTKHAYLHQKYFYLRLKYKWISGFGGIVHYSQWGGKNESYGRLPQDFNAFLETVFALGSTDLDAPVGEQTNAAGNSIAGYDFGIKIRRENFWLDIERFFYLEDKVSTRFRSPWDGMWSANLNIKRFEFLYEHINTKRQDSFDFEPRGSANYYNHFVYRSGWTYNRRVLGNSLILTDGSLESPIVNNILIAHHVGVSVPLSSQIQATVKYTFSRNYGIYRNQLMDGSGEAEPTEYRPLDDLRKNNHSLFAEFTLIPKTQKSIEFGIQLAGDFGEWYPNRVGTGLTIRYKTDQPLFRN